MTAAVKISKVNHHFGAGEMRKQVLTGISCEIEAGEIVILTGPSGSGKTTLLTLIGALRSAQEGSVSVFGRELRGADTRTLTEVRRDIGYIFQLHNLLGCLSTTQNVEMSLQLHGGLSGRERRKRALAALEAVGLGDKVDEDPGRMSGGQKQRVAIARALVSEPKLILADEPTASLDKKSGRDVVDLMRRLAKEKGVSVVLVTHDNRILDVADRIVHLEDGHLSSFSDAVLSNTRQMMTILAEQNRKGELQRQVAEMGEEDFLSLLDDVTRESQQLLDVSELASNQAFESMLEQVLEVFTSKIAEVVDADRASLFLVDRERNQLWSKGSRDAEGKQFTIKIPLDHGIVGAAISSRKVISVADVYADSRFDPSVDRESGYRTRNLLCIPVRNRAGEVFAAAQILNKNGDEPFNARDEERFSELMESMKVILESWCWMSERARRKD
jgi:putative ABC transport system ATP-binding protein